MVARKGLSAEPLTCLAFVFPVSVVRRVYPFSQVHCPQTKSRRRQWVSRTQLLMPSSFCDEARHQCQQFVILLR